MAATTARAIWSGSISFGLLAIPVRLFTAIREKTIHFRSLHDQDQVPLKQKMVCPADGKEVHREHIVKGYEIQKDRFVVVRQEELEAVAPKGGKTIDVLDFVALAEIDPLYFDRPYYLLPKPEGAKPYKLLYDAMESTGMVGISTIVMFNKQYLAALRPLDQVLCLDTMHFSDEVVSTKDLAAPEAAGKVSDREAKAAVQLVNSLATKFNAGKYRDEYRERVMEMIQKKAAGEEVVTRPETEPSAPDTANLIAALEASIAKARAGAGGGGGGNGHARAAAHAHTAGTARASRKKKRS